MSTTRQTDQQSERFISNLTKNTVAIILAGGRGSRLKSLTDWRAKPAVQFGASFVLSTFHCPIASTRAFVASMWPRNTKHKA